MKIQTLLISFILFFLLLIFFFFDLLFAEDFITKGPAPGEIYFKAPPSSPSGCLTLYHSYDYGETLTLIDSTSEFGAIAAGADSGGIYSIIGSNGGLYYSSNYGNTWNYQYSGIGIISSSIVPGEIFAGFTYSQNYGSTFIIMNANGYSGWFENATGGIIAGEYYVLEQYGKIYHSINYGNDFVQQSNLNHIYAEDYDLRRGAQTGELFLFNKNTQKLFFSSDSGKTFYFKYQFSFQSGVGYEWYLGIVGSQIIGEVFVIANKLSIYPSNEEFYIYHSADYGQSWNYHHHLTKITEESGNVVKDYYLSQNYPNPFNGETNIEISLPNSTYTEISIYNIEGKLIKTLLSKKLPAGKYSTKWTGINNNGKAVASGVYFYRLETPDFKQTKKMFYIR